jgi:Leucine-rich repeat (LRR) protein
VTYSNIHVPGIISTPHHEVWWWLAKRSGRIAGLSLQLCLLAHPDAKLSLDKLHEMTYWMKPLETLIGIPSVHLGVECRTIINDRDHLCLTQWLKRIGEKINHLTMALVISEDRLKLEEFAEAAAACQSIDLMIEHDFNTAINLAELAPLGDSLQCLTCCRDWGSGGGDTRFLKGLSALDSFQQLTSLVLFNEDLTADQPWAQLAKLTSLKELSLKVDAHGDSSPLSMLTRLTSLEGPSFSSLQPLSALQQLQRLKASCSSTSLHGLAGLSSLTELEFTRADGLRSLEGIGSGVAELSIRGASDLVSLAGIEGCSSLKHLFLEGCRLSSLPPLGGLSSLERLSLSMCRLTSLRGLCGSTLQSLSLRYCSYLTDLCGIEQLTALKELEIASCGVTSLQPLSLLGEGLQNLSVHDCRRVQEVVLELPHIQPKAKVEVWGTGMRQVVLAGGVSIAVS